MNIDGIFRSISLIDQAISGRMYDPDRYDLVEKPDYRRRVINTEIEYYEALLKSYNEAIELNMKSKLGVEEKLMKLKEEKKALQ